MRKNYISLFFTVVFGFLISWSQNTIGTIVNSDEAYEAYSLFTVAEETYLINNCGQLVNQWTSDHLSGKSVYLLPDGSLLRAEEIINEDVPIPGIGGRLTIRDWNNNLTWEYEFSSPTITQHHDIYPLPNGNILVSIIKKNTSEQAIAAGRNPDNLIDGPLYDERIIEIQPVGNNEINVIWEWRFWDHLIQEFDDTKENFGDVLMNPQLLDINYLGISNSKMNWLHVNSIQYNSVLDQIVISSRQLNEIYIIDHSTSSEEAASHTGGTYGKGGDFLYRWGNPASYKAGDETDQKLFGQHNPHWIPDSFDDEGKILVFNNGFNRPSNYSSVDILSPTQNPDGSYSIPTGKKIGPEDFDWTYIDPDAPVNFYSKILSNAQRLANGNTLICEGTKGHFFEIDENKNIVWEYISPIGNNGALTQGDEPAVKSVFRATKYGVDSQEFIGKDLSPGDPIELDFNLDNCQVLAIDDVLATSQLIINNPVQSFLSVTTDKNIKKIEVYSVQGQRIMNEHQKKNINFTHIQTGIYFLKIYTDEGVYSRRIIKI